MNKPNSNESDHWKEIQLQINEYLQEILLQIEWHYGDCRAPFFYPIEYKCIVNKAGIVKYAATIALDQGDDERLRYMAETPDILFKLIKKDITNKYGLT